MKEKCKRICTISSIILILYLVVPCITFTISAVTGFMAGWNEAAAEGPTNEPFWLITLNLVLAIVSLANMIVPIVTAIRLLLGVRKSDSPFTEQNGKRIGTIGICFMLIEPLGFVYDIVCSGVWNIDNFVGLPFSAGLVMLCVSYIFRYGCELQQESDETI